MKRKIIIVTVIILAAVGTYGYNAYRFVNERGECGLSAGPCFGQKIKLKLNNIKVDQYLDCPNGRIGFISTRDTLTPIAFKINSNLELLWAFKLESDSCSGVPFKQMSGMEISEDNGMKRIHFFNKTYSEPGTIYLTDDYDFKYLCLSLM